MSSKPYYARSSDPSTMTLTSNADMTGITVVVANVIVSFCSRILVSWSPSTFYIDSGIKGSLIQAYPILLSTLLIANRGQMCAEDANYATMITSPPLMVYLTVSSILDLLGIKTDLYKRIDSHPHITRAFGALILPIWFSVSLIIGTSSRAFYNGKGTDNWMFWWWWSLPVTLFTSELGLVILVFISFPALFLYRRWSQVMKDFRAYREGSDKPQRMWCRPWWFVKCACAFMRCAWRIIDRNHRWFVNFVFISLDCTWVCWVVVVAQPASWHAYALTYGQLLSVFAAAPPIISVGQLAWDNRPSDPLRLLIGRLLSLFLAEVRYLATGFESGPPVENSHLPFAVTPDLEAPAPGNVQRTASVRSTPGSAGGDDDNRSHVSTLVNSDAVR